MKRGRSPPPPQASSACDDKANPDSGAGSMHPEFSDVMTMIGEDFAAAMTERGIASFRPGQQDAISSVVQERSTLFVSPTGSGKSLVFLAAAFQMQGTCIVVSPLNSLIKDQVNQYQPLLNNGALDFMNGDRLPADRCEVVSRIGRDLKVLLTSPEMFLRYICRGVLGYRDAHKRHAVSFVTFDEADTALSWGERFRHDYRQAVANARRSGRPILAITATLPQSKAKHLLTSMAISPANVIVVPGQRANLNYRFVSATTTAEADALVLSELQNHRDGSRRPAIVYAQRKNDVDMLFDLLSRTLRGKVFKYHSGMLESAREQAHNGWERSADGIMVATIAFGLGINRMNVGLVVEYGVPSSPSDYVQQAGRAARAPKSTGTCSTIMCTALHERQLNVVGVCNLTCEKVTQECRAIVAKGVAVPAGTETFVALSPKGLTLSVLTWLDSVDVVALNGSAFAGMRLDRDAITAVAATNPRAWAVFKGRRVSGVFKAKTIHECDLIQYCYDQDRFRPTSSRFTNRSEKFILIDRQADPDALAEAFMRYEKGRLEDERAQYLEMWRLTGIGMRRGAAELTRGLEKHFGLTSI